jgi:hypothetical protein
VVVTQLREVPAAEGSGEAAKEHHDDGAACEEVVERDGLTVSVGKGELRGLRAYRRTSAVNGHRGILRRESQVARGRTLVVHIINQGVRGFDFDVRDG